MSLPSKELLERIVRSHEEWLSRRHPYETDSSTIVDTGLLQSVFDVFTDRLDGTYPFFHPSYAGQMLKPPHPVAVAGYLAAMLMNPNNHALDGGPVTGEFEKEVTADIAAMFGYETFLGHLTSSGTIANLEALWVSCELHPGKAIAFSQQSHYTHGRMCGVLGVEPVEIPATADGHMRMDALRSACQTGRIGAVVATLGTTGLGALDPLPELLHLRNEFGFRILLDAAYGGFFTLIAQEPNAAMRDDIFRLTSQCDSIVVDPHKHGLQPYGCGCVLFRDPAVGRFYKHDSPYTYFTSTDLHLGEISLECSRAGASAAALWLTLQCLPLRGAQGLGKILMKSRQAALRFSNMISASDHLALVTAPELDIVAYFPVTRDLASSVISKVSDEIFTSLMNDPEYPVYISKLRIPSAQLAELFPELKVDEGWTTVLRSVLMKPEHEAYAPVLFEMIETRAKGLI